MIATLPDDAALTARITWAAMSEARRADPLFAALSTAGHATAEQVDELFRVAIKVWGDGATQPGGRGRALGRTRVSPC